MRIVCRGVWWRILKLAECQVWINRAGVPGGLFFGGETKRKRSTDDPELSWEAIIGDFNPLEESKNHSYRIMAILPFFLKSPSACSSFWGRGIPERFSLQMNVRFIKFPTLSTSPLIPKASGKTIDSTLEVI